MGSIENQISAALDRALPSIAIRLQNELIIRAPFDTGRLRNSIKVTVTPIGLKITMVDYGKFVEFGRNPRIIYPKNKDSLKFKIGNKEIFSKKVVQGAVRPNPFIRETLQTKLKNIIVEELMKEF